MRRGGVGDDPEDLSWPVWAGVVPLRTVAGEPLPDAGLDASLSPPAEVLGLRPA